MVVGQLGVYGMAVLLHAEEDAILETEHVPIQVHNMAGSTAKVQQLMMYYVVCCSAQVCISMSARCLSTQLLSLDGYMNTVRYCLNSKHPYNTSNEQ